MLPHVGKKNMPPLDRFVGTAGPAKPPRPQTGAEVYSVMLRWCAVTATRKPPHNAKR